MEKIDIVILDHADGDVTIVKADQDIIEEYFGNDLERYIEEVLKFKLSEISWMSGPDITVEIFGGAPNGGLQVSNEDYITFDD